MSETQFYDACITADSSASSMVSVVGNEWVNIRAYFMGVQGTVDDSELTEFVSRLPEVKHSLEVIRKTLMQERTQMILSAFVPQLRIVDKHIASSASSRSDVCMASQRPLSRQYKMNSNRKMDGVELSLLPPCYTFLWDDPSCASLEHRADMQNGGDDGGGGDAGGELSSIGHVFLLSLCQFAKHNDPPGSRIIILDFLTRILSEADLPRSPYAGDPPRSLLQMFPGSTIVPLVDMLRQVATGFRPKAVTKKDSVGILLTSDVPVSEISCMVEDECEAFLKLLCALTERIEQVPALAMFFLPEAFTDVKDSTESKTKPDVSPAMDPHFSIFQELLTFVTLCQGSSPHSKKQPIICELALRGLLSLAKCPDPVVQDYVKKQIVVANITLTGARSTLLTLCKVPYNDDASGQLTHLCNILHFWMQILLLSPAVAEAWGIEGIIESKFVCDTLIPLFCAPEDFVYNAAALVAAKTVNFVCRTPPIYVSAITRALLNTHIDNLTGKPVHLMNASCSKTPSSLPPTMSLLDYALLPHLSIQNNDDWNGTEVTLYLLHSLALYEPVLFMEYALSLSMSALAAEVHLKASQCYGMHSTKPKGVDSRSTDSNTDSSNSVSKNGAGVIAINFPSKKTRYVDCFQPPAGFDLDLSAATTAPSLDVSDCFPVRLRAPKGMMLWTNADVIAEDILARLLLVESHVPVCILEKRQCVINRSCRGAHGGLADSVLEGKSYSSNPHETSSTTLEENISKLGSENIWFHSGVHRSRLVEHLCELTSHMMVIPSSVCSLLTQLWSTMCVLPDFRVLYTLMDSEHGRLRQSLLILRDAIDDGLQHDENLAYALASAAAALVRKKNKKSEVVEVMSNDKLPGIGGNIAVDVLHNTASHLYTRTYLYMQFIELGNSLCWVKDINDQEFQNKELLLALKKHRVFLEACASVEAFRMELDSAVGHVALSHNLMCLQTGNERTRRVSSSLN